MNEPTTARGRRTRDTLLRAAREVFESKGFLDARVADITRAAGVSHGTFYTYFDSTKDIFRTVMRTLVDNVYAASRVPPGTPGDPVARIDAANRGYVEAFARNAKMLGVLYQVGTFDEEFATFMRDVRRLIVERAARGLRRLQDQGLADPALHPDYAASSLVAMVEHVCYLWLCAGEPFDADKLQWTLTRLWAQAIGLNTAAVSADGSGA